MTEIHKEIIRKLVSKERELLGDVAMMQAGKLGFIEIDKGKVVLKGEPGREELEKTIDTFRKIVKGGAVGAAREVLKEYPPEELASEDLPEEILPKEVKIQKFSSAF